MRLVGDVGIGLVLLAPTALLLASSLFFPAVPPGIEVRVSPIMVPTSIA